jgi:hypothetical protein
MVTERLDVAGLLHELEPAEPAAATAAAESGRPTPDH